MSLIYSFIKVFFRFALKCYFRRIEIVGVENVPKDSPLLITPNHQNAFLDAFLVGAFAPTELHFLTRSDVFKWWSMPVMKLFNMIPVYRIRDGYSRLSKNEAIFKACEEIFARKKSVLMFAEGDHGEHHYLRPITKGAARLALQSQISIEGDIKVLPVGLNYFDHQAACGKVMIVFGEPIPVSEFVPQYKEHNGKGLNTMKDRITEAMKSTLIIPEKTEDYELVRRTVFRRKNEPLSFSKLRNIQPKDQIEITVKQSHHIFARILNPIPFMVIRKVLAGVDDVVFHSSLKFAIGLIFFPLWWLGVFFAIKLSLEIITALTVVLIMIFTLFASYKWLK